MKSMCPTFQALSASVWRQKIEGKYAVNPVTGCWQWLAACDRYGYGAVAGTLGGRQRNTGAHRASWIAHRGPILDGLTIDHLCWNRKCINPDHLEPVTFEENARRMMEVRACMVRTRRKPRVRSRRSAVPVPLSERRGCSKHGQSNGAWRFRNNSTEWRCRICDRARWHRRKPKPAAA